MWRLRDKVEERKGGEERGEHSEKIGVREELCEESEDLIVCMYTNKRMNVIVLYELSCFEITRLSWVYISYSWTPLYLPT